jgi:hypothetical protein
MQKNENPRSCPVAQKHAFRTTNKYSSPWKSILGLILPKAIILLWQFVKE